MADIKESSSSSDVVYVPFSRSVYNEIERESKERGKPIRNVISDALKVDQWARNVQKQGGRIIVEPRRGKKSEITIK